MTSISLRKGEKNNDCEFYEDQSRWRRSYLYENGQINKLLKTVLSKHFLLRQEQKGLGMAFAIVQCRNLTLHKTLTFTKKQQKLQIKTIFRFKRKVGNSITNQQHFSWRNNAVLETLSFQAKAID